MISVGSRDAKKRLELGYGDIGNGGGRVMDDTELEEGEACSNQNDEHDATVDPDVALSYIDVKIQDVLGHFQKDFETEVSLETLGRKFGGYGSFLSAQQRSPPWSQPKTPPKIQNCNIPRSPNLMELECGRSNPAVYSTVSQTVRHGPTSSSSTGRLATKALSKDNSNGEVCCQATHPGSFTSNPKSLSKKANIMLDQKPLKVRIKMGRENLPTKKNAAIYSGLGLDVSPSLSNDSQSESEEISHKSGDAPFESPTSILQIMTSFPPLLSPLADDLVQFAGKGTYVVDKSVPTSRNNLENSDAFVRGTDFVEGDWKMPIKKMKQRIGDGDITKEAESRIPNCEEIVSKTLKLPFVSILNADTGDSSEGTTRPFDNDFNKAIKSAASDREFSDLFTKKHYCTEDNELFEKFKDDAVENGVNNNNGPVDDLSMHKIKGNQKKGERSCSSKIEPVGRTAQNAESAELPKNTHNISSYEQDMSPSVVTMENQYSGEKKKSKENHVHRGLASDVQDDTLKVASSLLHKQNKNSDESHLSSKKDISDVNVQKDSARSKERYREMIGNLGENRAGMDLSDSCYENKPRDPEVVTKSTATDDAQKAKTSSKKIHRPSSSTRYLKTAAVGQCPANGPVKDVDEGNGALGTVVAEDNWVQCDRCQKWRLLPAGKNPESLPDKWVCSMLDWLPSMNSCSINEEETRKAVLALYQVPILEGQHNLPNIAGSIVEGGNISSVQHADQYLEDCNLQELPVGKEKPVGELLDAANMDRSENLSSSIKNVQISVRRRSLNDTNRSPTNSGSSFHKQRMSNDLAGEKHKHKKKSRGILSDEAKSWKVKRRLDSNQDASGANKKGKTEKMNSCPSEQKTDHHGALLKAHQNPDNNVRTVSYNKDKLKHKDKSSSKDSKHDMKERLQLAVKKQRDRNQDASKEGYLDEENNKSKDSFRKRKFEEHHDTQNFVESIQITDHQQDIGVSVQEIFSENDSRMVKKARLSNPENKKSSTSKVNDRNDKRGSHEIHKELEQDLESLHKQQPIDGTDCVKRDLASIQDPAGTASSSSKVSGSHRTKVSFQEVKGSPVESVSSSPMRISNLDKLALSSKEQLGKGESNGGQCLDGEDNGGSDRSATTRKQKNSKSCTADFWKKDPSHLSGTKSDVHVALSQIADGGVHEVGQHTPLLKPQILGKCEVEDRPESSNYSDPPRVRKSGKGSSSRSKEKNKNFRPNSIGEKIKSSDQLRDHSPSHETKYRDVKTRSQDIFGVKSDGNGKKTSRKKDFGGKLLDDGTCGQKHWNTKGHEHCEVRRDATSTSIHNLLVDFDGDKSSKRLLSEKSEQVDQVSGRGKSLYLPSGGAKNEAPPSCPHPVSGAHQVNGNVEGDASKFYDESKLQQKQARKIDNQSRTQLVSSTKHTSNEHGTKEVDAPCAIKRDSSTHAANNALKEAKDLKHLADRLKNSGSSESTGYYFEAALKFLHGASLLECSNNGNAKYNEMAQSKQVYSSTAKLCEFCAHEYERAKDMGAAALAYKCMEVAYMRVIYSSHVSASRDRHELQRALQVAPLGESPSSSGSDVDNLNNSAAPDKVVIHKGGSSPQVSGMHIISARNWPSALRLLNFTQDVNFAMEASRRSQSAFAIINAIPLETKNAEGISSIKKALDFNFIDVEGLLKLVRLAMEAISR